MGLQDSISCVFFQNEDTFINLCRTNMLSFKLKFEIVLCQWVVWCFLSFETSCECFRNVHYSGRTYKLRL